MRIKLKIWGKKGVNQCVNGNKILRRVYWEDKLLKDGRFFLKSGRCEV